MDQSSSSSSSGSSLDLRQEAKSLQWRLEFSKSGKVTTQELQSLTGLSKSNVKELMSYYEEKFEVKMATKVSGHKGNSESPNIVWNGASILNTTRLLDKVKIIIINGIQIENEAEKTFFKHRAEVENIGPSMAEAFMGQMKTDTVLVIR